MKKQIFLVSALVAMAMSAMFVSCKDKNEPADSINGCMCTIEWTDGTEDSQAISLSDMKAEYGVTSCSKLEAILNEEQNQPGKEWFITLYCDDF
ncbi:MAG: hypothetical protein ACI30A_07375 [Paludibacteraceae bacterium]